MSSVMRYSGSVLLLCALVGAGRGPAYSRAVSDTDFNPRRYYAFKLQEWQKKWIIEIGKWTVRELESALAEYEIHVARLNIKSSREPSDKNIRAYYAVCFRRNAILRELERKRNVTPEKHTRKTPPTYTPRTRTEDMVYVAPGTYPVGSNRWPDNPPHKVTLTYGFYIDRTEMTQSAYWRLTRKNPSRFPGNNRPVERVSFYNGAACFNLRSIKKGLVPVYYSDKECRKIYTMEDADFRRKVFSRDIVTTSGYRFPTGAEWEIAARGGNKSRGYIYSGSNKLSEVAGTTIHSTYPVRQYKPNELGIYGMSGNVWEWTWNWHEHLSTKDMTNPVGPKTGMFRVVRGGCWYKNKGNFRVDYRYPYEPYRRYSTLGLRAVRTRVK